MMMKEKNWIIGWLLIVLAALSAVGVLVYRVDPFFHFHGPDLERYYYTLDNPRSQNDGICRHFDYDAMITGTSMTENFKTSEADRLFQKNFVKVIFVGGTYKEVNDNILRALERNPNLKTVIRSLEIGHFYDPADAMRYDLGSYPDYLYDENPFNDVKYLLNRDVLFGRVLPMLLAREKDGFRPGITTFDDYSWSMEGETFGINRVCPYGIERNPPAEQAHLSEEDREAIRKNIALNVTDTADRYPDVDFYCFYPPFSIDSWCYWNNQGVLQRELEAEAYATELLIGHKNIHLYSFNDRTDIITDLNHYRDGFHYGSWVNSLILKWIREGTGLLTEENYRERMAREAEFFTTFDYNSVAGQEDYEADYYAGALTNRELTGAEPFDVLAEGAVRELKLAEGEGRGFACEADLSAGYRYLVCDLDSAAAGETVTVRIRGEDGGTLLERSVVLSGSADTTGSADDGNTAAGTMNSADTAGNLRREVLDLSPYSGRVTVEFLLTIGDAAAGEGTSPIVNIVLY